MDIENEVFKRTHVDLKKLKEYGFQEENNQYKYSCNFMDDNFKADITINKNGIVSGKIYDLQMNEEYTNIRIENSIGEFVNTIREEYIKILKDIKKNCFEKSNFIFDQTNRVSKYIFNKYGDEPEFLWEKFQSDSIFRNKNNNKWYAIIMNVDKSKITNETGEIEIIDVKVPESKINELLKKKGYYKGYHMNKKNWITIILDDTISDEELFDLIDNSYNLINVKESWIVPANPKYYDIIKHFSESDIIEWKQSSDVHVGDIVYIYVGSPYSSILYKCQAIEVNIPYEYKDANIVMSYVMKLKLLKQYPKAEISFTRLNELGIMAIRGPRKISEEINKMF